MKICLSLFNLQTMLALFTSAWTKSLRTGSAGDVSTGINTGISFQPRRAPAAIVSMQRKNFQEAGYRTKLQRSRTLSMIGIVGDPYTAVMIVPTGIGASIGGYAGDALPSAR